MSQVNLYNNIIWGNIFPSSLHPVIDLYFEPALGTINVYNNNFDPDRALFDGDNPANLIFTNQADNINADPLFVDSSNGDYHLRPNSPCINRGFSDTAAYPLLPADDMDGTTRPQKGRYDMGAYEYNFGNTDFDGDGVFDLYDNCLMVKNPDQCDSDGDKYGNACDGDLNNDGRVNTLDLGLFKKGVSRYNSQADFNCDGMVNTLDLGLFKKLMSEKKPGPSGLVQ